MRPESPGSRWETLQANAHLPEAQAIIRREIFRGEIRVVPAPSGGIRIIPARASSPVERPEPTAGVEQGRAQEHRGMLVLPIERRS